MLSLIKRRALRLVFNIKKISNYVTASLLHPQLFFLAVRYVVCKCIRFFHGLIRAGIPKFACQKHKIETDTCSRADLLALLGRIMGVVVLREDKMNLVIGVRDVDFQKAIITLRDKFPIERLIIDGISGERNDANIWRAYTASQVSFVFSSGERVDLESYERRGAQYWLSKNKKNRSARAIYEDILEKPGVIYLSKILPALTLEQKAQCEPVDVVYTWVNHRDQEWAKSFSYHLNLLNGQAKKPEGINDSMSISRFHSIDELRYSLRSVHKNLPWSRRIHVLTNCAPPSWLDVDHEQINWIDHQQIIPDDYLPTFSSHVIESYLHHIPGLTNRFIYMNDDFFVVSPKDKLFFFSETGNTRAFLEDFGVVSGSCRDTDPDYLNASRNSANLLLNELDFWPTRLHKHTPYSLKRDILMEIEGKWKSDFSIFRRNKFRSINDLNLTSFLYHHYALATGRAEVASVKLSLVMPIDVRWQNRLSTALCGDVDVLCINEGGVLRPAPNWHSSVSRFLQNSFFQPAPWEQHDGHV
ncbi:stealth conserved region 3 domain-containing protein [Paracoccus acridae]|uniref:stealth conserved region 3 domain-containing protein n=1 Tax=Paracoccus acridae TaxID=1795310 RepID=UPI001664AAD0|nr:stealth conserved region 3 domain-containing protein [Paracoccus acridae]